MVGVSRCLQSHRCICSTIALPLARQLPCHLHGNCPVTCTVVHRSRLHCTSTILGQPWSSPRMTTMPCLGARCRGLQLQGWGDGESMEHVAARIRELF